MRSPAPEDSLRHALDRSPELGSVPSGVLDALYGAMSVHAFSVEQTLSELGPDQPWLGVIARGRVCAVLTEASLTGPGLRILGPGSIVRIDPARTSELAGVADGRVLAITCRALAELASSHTTLEPLARRAALPGAPDEPLRLTLLRSHVFGQLDAELVDQLLLEMTPREFEDGDHLVRQGQQGGWLGVIVEGKVTVTVTDHEGDEHMLNTLEASDVFGEMALLTDRPRQASVVASGAVRVLVLEADAFQRVAASHPEVTVVLTELLANRLGEDRHDALGGKRIDDYTIVQRVGRGATSVVYEALEESTNASVALKMMDHRLVFQPRARQRFVRETELLSALSHENIARVVRCFSAFRTSFLVMELYRGPSLQGLIQQHGGFEEPAVRALLGQLALALQHIHAADVVHRDLKPANVLLTPEGVVKLTDFGLAKPQGELDAALTVEGSVLGTPLYMAPEQMLGTESGSAADIYAFGVMGVELVTGLQTFRGKTLQALMSEKAVYRLPSAEELGVSQELRDTLAGCLHWSEDAREWDLATIGAWAAPFRWE